MPGLADCTETSDSMSASYSLYAVSNHMGSLRGGHYTAYCRHPTKKRWFEFNDQHVQAVQVRPQPSFLGIFWMSLYRTI